MTAGGDPFGTGALRSRVLEAWQAAPARFREDANAEEDLALGAYRDRLVVELAQNAADAAVRAGPAGEPGAPTGERSERGAPAGERSGRLLLRLTGRTLLAANTGAPLDPAGVEALSTLRASAKRSGDTVGRFGVGFAAVLAVTDEPSVLSHGGGVHWSRRQAHEQVAAVPSLADELARRGGGVPVLRLPFAADGAVTDVIAGYDTVVRLPLRDDAAAEVARRALTDVDAALLLTLPGLGEVVVDCDGTVRTMRAAGGTFGDGGTDVLLDEDGRRTRWRTVTGSGVLDPALLADRPTEERGQRSWSVTWAVPVDEQDRPLPLPDPLPRVVHAPTPTDERLRLPALFVAGMPLDPTRRHVAAGPLRDFLLARGAEQYRRLVLELADDAAVLGLVPGPVPTGEVDGLLRELLRHELAGAALLPSAGDPDRRLRGADAVVLGAGAAGLADPGRLAGLLPALVDPAWSRGQDRLRALRTLGVREMPLADLVDAMADLRLDPAGWRGCYDALEGADPEALGALPVPLADGRVVRGPRGVLLPPDAADAAGLDLAALAPLGLRVVHPDAAHPLLARLGAVPATAQTLLDDSAVRAAVATSFDADDPAPVAEAVLGLVAAAGTGEASQPWLADLALPAEDGEWYPAGELLLAGGLLAEVVAEDAPFGVVSTALLARWGEEVLVAVGVLRTFAVLTANDVALDPVTSDHDLDGEAEWMEDVRAALPDSDVPPLLPELVAVRDLELVRQDRWPQVLDALSRPPFSAAITGPAFALLPDGRRVAIRTYTSWWLGRHAVLDGHAPTDLRIGADPGLVGLYAPAPATVDPGLLRALGARTSVPELLAEPDGADELLGRLGDPGLEVTREALRALYVALADVPTDMVSPPETVRAVQHGRVVVADPADVLVLDAPDLLPLVDDRPLVLVPIAAGEAVADLLALPVASEVVPGQVQSSGRQREVPAEAAETLDGRALSWFAHEPLVVDGTEVGWRVVDGVAHVATGAGGPGGPAGDLPGRLARALALAAGCWDRRHLVEAVLREPERAAELRVEADLDGAG